MPRSFTLSQDPQERPSAPAPEAGSLRICPVAAVLEGARVLEPRQAQGRSAALQALRVPNTEATHDRSRLTDADVAPMLTVLGRVVPLCRVRG